MSTRKKFILVAEDDVFLADMMRKALTKRGVRVVCVYNGQEAIAALDAGQPDLLLLDLLMPHVDGYAVLDHKKEKKMDFPVVVCTNLSDKKTKERCKDLGVKGYLVKSDMDSEQIWPAIEKYVR